MPSLRRKVFGGSEFCKEAAGGWKGVKSPPAIWDEKGCCLFSYTNNAAKLFPMKSYYVENVEKQGRLRKKPHISAIQVRFKMLSKNQLRAVGLLFEMTDEEVARRLRISRDTLDQWKQSPEFVQALCERLKENRQMAGRILSQICVQACRQLQHLIESDDERNKPKAIIDVLKASGLFKELEVSEGDYVSSLLERFADDVEEAEREEED
jgi:hypothetical protein